MTPSLPRTPTCPERALLLAMAEGSLSEQEASHLDAHLSECEACELTLDSLEEDSDTLVRSLASLPVSSDDELAFQHLHQRLLAAPQRFQGELGDDPTEIFAPTFPIDLVLPYRLGNYDLLEQIGAGAHGAVFRARHRRLDRPAAVKLLLHAAKSAIDDFLNEMRVIGQLDHPNIIRATDAGEVDGLYFLVMEYVAGVDVSTLLQRLDVLNFADACEIARQAALGLAVAHQHDLVHRDVKTSNLLFTSQGQVKLLDLGLAKIGSREHHETSAEHVPRGTADYMAPEQWLESENVDRRADIYSLGCTLFKLITGETPYRTVPDGYTSKRQAHIQAQIPSARAKRNGVPPLLDQLIQRLLAKEPMDRPPSAEIVADELARFARDANLPRLATQLFPLEAGLEGTKIRRFHRGTPWLTRRNAIVTGVVAIGASVGWATIRPKPRGLQVNQWREIGPSEPSLLRIPGTSPATMDEQDSQLELRSEGPALLHLGKPLRRAFRLRTTVHREAWGQGAGVFFGFRLEQPAPDAVFGFQTLHVKTEDGVSVLAWLAHQVPPADSIPLTLAETEIAPVSTSRPCLLEVTLGRVGFPEVRVNDLAYPKTSWQVSREGRDLTVISPEQLRVAFAGRIGLFHQGGRTSFGPNQLMYLDR